MLDTYVLQVFVMAAETLNFTEAAKRLHMSQPAVSQHIQNLERQLGLPLFLRQGRRVMLTDAGRVLLPMARDLVQRSVQIEEEMISLQGEVFGRLIVGCSTTPGKYLLPHLLARFHSRFPKVQVACYVNSQQETADMLCSGEVHFSLSSWQPPLCRNAEATYFTSDPVVLIAPADHPWAQQEAITPSELLTGTFIMREASSGTYQAVAAALNRAQINVEDLHTSMTLGNSEAIAIAVQNGLGVGFVSQIVVQNLIGNGVVIIPIQGVEICRDIYISRSPKAIPTRAQETFWEFIQDLPVPFLPPNCSNEHMKAVLERAARLMSP